MPPLETLLDHLLDNRVELILVGGLAAITYGAPITTSDLEIVHRRTPDNVNRLVNALLAIGARYRGTDAVLRPSAAVLLGPGHSLLSTRLGPIDVLGAIDGGRDYDGLLPETHELALEGRRVRVPELATIVAIKRASGHPRDMYMLPVLEATLRRRG
jgi:hypothetical protein